MTWVRLDDNAPGHPKIGALSDAAFRAWVEGLCYSAKYLTDGHLPTAFTRAVKPTARRELLATGLWDQNGTGLVIHDYLDFQKSRDRVEAERDAAAARQGRRRKSRSDVDEDPPGITA